MDEPELYRNISGNKYMRLPVFVGWCILAYFHSLIYYYLPYATAAAYPGVLDASGTGVLSNWDFGVLVITTSVVVINLKLYVMTKYWTFWTHVVYWGTMIAFLAFSIFYSLVPGTPVHRSFLQVCAI